MKSIGKLDFKMYAYNDDYDTVLDYTNVSLNTNLQPDTPSFDSDVDIYDADGVVIKARYGQAKYGDYNSIYVYAENNTDKTLRISVDSLDINGFTISSAYLYLTLDPGFCGVEDINLYEDTLSENHIDEIESMELSLEIRDADDWKSVATTDSVEIPVS